MVVVLAVLHVVEGPAVSADQEAECAAVEAGPAEAV